jgi:hypothetical protein
VRWFLFWTLLTTIPVCTCAWAQENVVQEFSGSGSTTTGLFKVQDRWEVRWNARQAVSVAVLSSDGTIVAGAAGVLRGSLFVPLGGQYYFKISDGTNAPAVLIAVPSTPPSPPLTNTAPVADTNTAPSSLTTNTAPVASTNAAPSSLTTNAAPVVSTNAAPSSPTTNAAPVASTNAPAGTAPSGDSDDSSSRAPETVVSWHLQVVELGTSVAAGQALTVYTPYFVMPDSAVTPVASADLPPPKLTDEQIRAIVTIKGDNAQGAGFLMQSPEGHFVVTHLHLLAANPNLTIATSSGAAITTLAVKGAVDRDLALLTVQDDHYSYLPLPADVSASVEEGDQVIIPDIGQQGDVMLGKPGKVIGISPGRIDFDNPMGPGSGGAPMIGVKGGNVLALITAEKKVDVSTDLAKAWAANPAPGSASIIPYFGLRLDGVPGWETYDSARFLAETLFLQQFHQQTRCLDSYLNGRRHRSRNESETEGPPDTRYFLKDDKVRFANDTYKQQANGADQGQRLDAARELLFDLDGIADTNLKTLQDMTNLYAFDAAWAREELAYRVALKKELENLGSNIVRLDNIARAR